VRPPKRTVMSWASSKAWESEAMARLLCLFLALLAARGLAAEAVAQRCAPGLEAAPRLAEGAPAHRGQATGQVQHREDEQEAQRHHVDLRHLQAQRLGQHAEDDGRDQ